MTLTLDPTIPRALFFTRDALNATALYRCIWPARHLSLRGYVADVATNDTFAERDRALDAGRYNLLVANSIGQASAAAVDQMLAAFRSWGLSVVYDADDDLFTPESAERMERLMPGAYPHRAIRDARVRFIRSVDAITVSRPALADVVRAYSDRPVTVVENAIDVDAFRDALLSGPPRQLPDATLTIGWSGASREPDDLRTLASAWARVATEHPDVHFVVQGGMRDNPLLGAVPADRLHHLPWVDLGEYPAALKNIDIGCAIIPDTAHGRCKSTNKWAEYALAGIPCVVSETVYGADVEHGVDALVANDVDGWAEALSGLIEQPKLRRGLAGAAANHVVRCHDVWYRWSDWVDAWRPVLAGARDRVPA